MSSQNNPRIFTLPEGEEDLFDPNQEDLINILGATPPPSDTQKTTALVNPTIQGETEAVTGVKPRDVSDFRANTSFIENYLMSVDPTIQQAFFKPGSSDRYTGTFAQAYKLVDGKPVEVEATPEDIAAGNLIYYVGGAPGSDYAGQSRVGQAYTLKDGKLTPIGEAKPYEAPEEKNFWMEGAKQAAALALAAYLGPGGGLESLLGSGATGTGGLAALGEGAGAAGTAGSITSSLASALPADLVSAGKTFADTYSQVRPYLQGANALYQASQGNLENAIVSGLGAAGSFGVPGAKEASQYLNAGLAASKGNYIPAVTSLLNTDTGKGLANTPLVGDLTLNDAFKGLNFVNALQAGEPTQILAAANQLIGSKDLATATSASRVVDLLKNPGDTPQYFMSLADATSGLARTLSNSSTSQKPQQVSESPTTQVEEPPTTQVAEAPTDAEVIRYTPSGFEGATGDVLAGPSMTMQNIANVNTPWGEQRGLNSRPYEKDISQGYAPIDSPFYGSFLVNYQTSATDAAGNPVTYQAIWNPTTNKTTYTLNVNGQQFESEVRPDIEGNILYLGNKGFNLKETTTADQTLEVSSSSLADRFTPSTTYDELLDLLTPTKSKAPTSKKPTAIDEILFQEANAPTATEPTFLPPVTEEELVNIVKTPPAAPVPPTQPTAY